MKVTAIRTPRAIYVHARGRHWLVPRQIQSASQESASIDILTPIPGVISRIFVKAGDIIEAGAPLYGLEAMKMETVVKAPKAGRVTKVFATVGSKVDAGTQVVEWVGD